MSLPPFANSGATLPFSRTTLPGFRAVSCNSFLYASEFQTLCGLFSHSIFSFFLPCIAAHVLSAKTATPPTASNSQSRFVIHGFHAAAEHRRMGDACIQHSFHVGILSVCGLPGAHVFQVVARRAFSDVAP